VRLATLVAVVAVWGAAAGIPAALVSCIDQGCCHKGVCCCRPGSSGHGLCIRSACRCPGHGADPAGAPALPHAKMPPVRFRLAAAPPAGSATVPPGAPALDGYARPILHPPPAPPTRSPLA
jgi:hypothetical protein